MFRGTTSSSQAQEELKLHQWLVKQSARIVNMIIDLRKRDPPFIDGKSCEVIEKLTKVPLTMLIQTTTLMAHARGFSMELMIAYYECIGHGKLKTALGFLGGQLKPKDELMTYYWKGLNIPLGLKLLGWSFRANIDVMESNTKGLIEQNDMTILKKSFEYMETDAARIRNNLGELPKSSLTIYWNNWVDERLEDAQRRIGVLEKRMDASK